MNKRGFVKRKEVVTSAGYASGAVAFEGARNCGIRRDHWPMREVDLRDCTGTNQEVLPFVQGLPKKSLPETFVKTKCVDCIEDRVWL